MQSVTSISQIPLEDKKTQPSAKSLNSANSVEDSQPALQAELQSSHLIFTPTDVWNIQVPPCSIVLEPQTQSWSSVLRMFPLNVSGAHVSSSECVQLSCFQTCGWNLGNLGNLGEPC
ncbi:unnamed protein product [Pleuronectes platessa]|uniref:Uncharacterized protein n=1 Tax=Pleuronectes platessa TaxID=8262 RepID=A0A9N7VJU3_PLEPL|nr:unnamed protein product [Pleuronectes platessa]